MHSHTYDTHSAIILSSKELFHFWNPDSGISYECLAHTHARTHRDCYLMETQIYDKIKLALQKHRLAEVQVPLAEFGKDLFDFLYLGYFTNQSTSNWSL